MSASNQSKPKRVGLFGGTFNPPHMGHAMVAAQAASQLGLDILYWIPAARSPFKDGEGSVSPHHRLAMTELAARSVLSADSRVLDLEMRRPPPSYSVDTVAEIRSRFPESLLFLLMGADSWDGFVKWSQPARIRDMATIAVYPRVAGAEEATDRSRSPTPDHSSSGGVTLIKAPRVEVSSTDIRRRLRQGETVDGLLAPAVLAYIRHHRLYPPQA